MTVEVFWGSGSPFAWRVLLALEFKGLEYTSHQLSFTDRDHKKPDYLAVNPRGKVPSLRHGDITLTETIGILAYIDHLSPAPPLFGNTPEAAGRVWQSVAETIYYFETHADRIIRPVFEQRIEGNKDDIRDAADQLHKEMARWNVRLNDLP